MEIAIAVIQKPEVHPDFASPADVTLVSDDGIMFHVASSQLAGASGWFRTLFSVPQGDAQQHEDVQHIVLSEDTLTLEILLKICCGRAPGLAKIGSIGALERCLIAAEKYEVEAALELLPLLLHKAHMQADPLLLYALAGRYGQDDVAASALKHLLTMRLDYNTIEHLDYPQLKLLVARRQERIERFCSILVKRNSDAPFDLENSLYCTRGPVQTHFHQRGNPNVWTALSLRLQTAFIKRPSVEALASDEAVKAQLASMETLTCEHKTCGLRQYEWRDIRLRLLQAMDEGGTANGDDCL